jgi:phospholipase C
VNPQQQANDPVKHVVLLMFENHSFDQMLGCFKEVYPDLAGIDPANPNVNIANGVPYKQRETKERHMRLDPRHEVNHVAAQMADHNGGFVSDFVKSYPRSSHEERAAIMSYYPLDFLPALHRLGREFLICDQWFSSVPGPTWANRFFALTGTSCGMVNMPEDGEHGADIKAWFQQDQPTIFDRLSDKHVSWRIYFHDIPQSVCLVGQRTPERSLNYFPFEQFAEDARGPEADFAAFTFIEPDYNGALENDDHPPHDVMKAQKLLADVYNAIRANPQLWEATLLVVLYDEHGGFYDHVEPPAAVPPDDRCAEFAFDRLGVRVPALLISPWVAQGHDPTQFDHTSLLKYLIDKWGLDQLGNRAGSANSIGKVIRKEPKDRPFAPIVLTHDQLTPPRPKLEEEAAKYISSHHKAMALIGRQLQLELLKESPLAFAWLTFLLELVLHWLLHLKRSWLFRVSHRRTKKHWADFQKRRRRQAIPKLAAVMRDGKRTPAERHHAISGLSAVANKRFHHENDPVNAAEAWLKQVGH